MNPFVISKANTAYLVSVKVRDVVVAPWERSKHNSTCKTIADTLQIIATTKLILAEPAHPVAFLKEYYPSKGWTLENAR